MTYATEVFQPLQADDPPVVGGYRLAARLGAGGMGRVYLSHTQGGRPVALKVVRPELADDPAFRQRFGREIKAARRVRGAYTAELIDADADGAPPWLATLYVPGPSLTEAVARRGPLPTPALLWLMAGVAEALQAIHGVGIVHRDLKPSNVLLAADGPRVIDFGISLASGVTAHTATGAAVGTPSFMAPEQASADQVTAATDVFALGQTAAFAALAEPLYGDGPAVSVLYRIVHSAPDLTRLPAELRPLLARCLAADPADRATPAEIVRWCRRQLDQDGAREAAPAVWREITGADAAPPAPGPVPTPPRGAVLPTVPTPSGGAVLPTVPTPPWGAVLPTIPAPSPVPGGPVPAPTRVGAPPAWPSRPPEPGARRPRRRRTALIAAAAVAGGAVLVTSWAWTVMDATDRFRHRGTTAATSSGRAVAARSADPRATASARTAASSA
ncbi:serine/threonine-protein kinase, partial [Streptomyces similanensis]|uniref:serine/threonine-protein kinase n=1 Tax=Streptomyces similanensis TaxID=1274988 RepID=UPI0031EBF2C5